MKSISRKRIRKSKLTVPTIATSARLVAEARTPAKKQVQSITASVRRIVVRNPHLTASDVGLALVKENWDTDEVKRRMSTIATLRTDCLATLNVAREEGWRTPTIAKSRKRK